MNEIEEKAGLSPSSGYRYAKQVGNQLYVSGQVPQNKSGIIVGVSNAYKQTQQCFTNPELVLNCHHFSVNDIQHITIYVVGSKADLSKAWKFVQEKFNNKAPPATLLGVSLLGHENQLVEVDATIIKKVA